MGIFELFKPNIEKLKGKRNVKGLIKALQHRKDKDFGVRLEAAEALGKIKDKRAVEPLIQALKNHDWSSIKGRAAWALGEIGDERAVEPLLQALRDDKEDRDVREYAAEALRKIGGPTVVPLIQDLNDRDRCVRWSAAEALGKIKDKRAVEPLFQTLKDEDCGVRSKAAGALEAIGWQPKDDLERAYHLVGKGEWYRLYRLVELGGSAVEPLIQVLKDKDKDTRQGAAEALGKIKDKRAVEPLFQTLKDEDCGVRSKAAGALGEIGDERAIGPLIQLLKDDKDSCVRENAAEALGDIKDRRAVEPLLQAFKDPNKFVRRHAASALGKIGDERGVEPLLQALKGDSIRSSAAYALGEIKDKRAVEPLIQALKDNDYGLCDPWAYDQRAAAWALGEIGDERAVEPLFQALEDLWHRRGLVLSTDSDLRKAVVKALGKIRWQPPNDLQMTYYKFLLGQTELPIKDTIELLKSKNKPACQMAAEFLLKFNDPGWRPENEEQRAYYLAAKRMWEELVAIGEPAIEPLIFASNGYWYKDSESYCREDAIRTLGKIKSEKAFEQLIMALNDGKYAVREEAANALGRIGNQRAVGPLIEYLEKEKVGSYKQIAVRALGMIGDLRACEKVLVWFLRHREELTHVGCSMPDEVSNLFGDYTDVIRSLIQIPYERGIRLFSTGDSVNRRSYRLANISRGIHFLCETNSPISNNILHLIIEQMKDIRVLVEYAPSDSLAGDEYVTLSFESERQKAIKCLEHRGNPPYESSVYLEQKAWKL